MIVITGSGGVLGAALVRELTASGDTFATISAKDVDLRDPVATESYFSVFKPDLVYHLAARVHGLGGNTKFPAEMYTDNIRINTNVIDSATRHGCKKFVAVSTVAIYSSDIKTPTSENTIWNGPPHASERPYGMAKRAMLTQLEAYANQFGITYAYPILTNIFGPEDRFDPEYGHVVPSLVAKFHRASREGGIVKVWGSGHAKRDFIYSEDAARALILVAERHEGPINIASGCTSQIRDVVEILARISDVHEFTWDATKPDGQLERSYDVSKLRGLGFRPRFDIERGLALTFDWYSKAYPHVRS
jgi:GDP-L-fucose synthase